MITWTLSKVCKNSKQNLWMPSMMKKKLILMNYLKQLVNKDLKFFNLSNEKQKIPDLFETGDKFRDLFQKVKENIGMLYNI